jgi:tRNA G37 N-methylase TrmD
LIQEWKIEEQLKATMSIRPDLIDVDSFDKVTLKIYNKLLGEK